MSVTQIRYRYTVSDNNNRGASAPHNLTEITMYKVKYSNNTLVLTAHNVKYMFDAKKLKLLELKQAIKDNTVDSLPRIAKFIHVGRALWRLAD